jgi:hypothetical protein
MSDANRVSVSYVAEGTWGTHPGGAMQTLRLRSESFRRNAVYADSQELRSDRQVAYTVLVDANGNGDLPFEFSYETYDDFWQAVIQSAAWAAIITDTEADVSFDAGDNSINSSGAGFQTTYGVGRWIKITGAGAGANQNKFGKIVSKTASKIVLSGVTITTVTGPVTATITQGAYIENGTTQPSFSIEKNFEDVASTFENIPGATVADVTLDTVVESILAGKFGFLSKPPTSATSSSGSSYTAATTSPVMNAVTNVAAVLEAGAAFAVREVHFTINNNLRERKQVGTLGAESIGAGTISVTGSILVYHAAGSAAVYAKFLADTVTDLALRFLDNDSKAYIFDFPNIKFTAGSRNATGINTDVMIPLEFRATVDASELKTIRIQRFA